MHPLSIRWARTQGQQDQHHRTPGKWLARQQSLGVPEQRGEQGWRLLVLAYEGGYADAQHRQDNPPSWLRWARGER